MDLIIIAKNVDIPSWATHVAVRNNGSKSEACFYDKNIDEYIDEDPKKVSPDSWAGSYNKSYWSFFSKEEILN